MSEQENAAARLKRMKEQREAQREAAKNSAGIAKQIVDETAGERDLEALAAKLKERQEREKKGENTGYVKLTIYIREDLAAAFNALITKRGQQKQFANEAIEDFVLKKARELEIE